MTEHKDKRIDSPSFAQLILTLDVRRTFTPAFLQQILATNAFVSVLIYDSKGDEAFLQKQAQTYAQDIQNNGAALLIAGECRIAERVKADGFHREGDLTTLEQLYDQKKAQKIIGFGNIRNRHSAMVAGEAGVDYLFFGKLGADRKPHAHPRNLQLAGWWAEIMEIPSIIQAGSDFSTFDEVLKTACEFIAVEEVIFGSNNPLPLLKKMQEKCVSASQ
ncbi:thiamine phosphate synthase [Bartonella pachyuromydis]|uniref:Thiamine phosphate synthase/TenI domain-containing protein n=1 Tax=Bartonella pachyuromydis TaxID=931097 RepID=A0ABP8VDF7_9HYPH